ncbi:hypothetical protein [Marinoscillum sp. MHG1-6]|uniref:hypothetical protein n=1 Tax=Marinoscillum sp. MHG1-6 TaxID=2959627 RepID=UPI002158A033|nr:hypothetical protein [Marinoscillum sp. MHG1-6]
MSKIKANKKSLIRWKVYIDRARMYIGYAQFLMIVFVLLEAYKDTSVGQLIFENLIVSAPILFIIFIGLSLIIGRLDTVFGLREEELRNSSSSNPVMRELLAKIDLLTAEIKELKEEK